MLVIGLTGPSGAGKSRVASLFEQLGLPRIDADAIYHALLEPPSPCLDELTEYFGAQILAEDGTLNRRALGQIVFHDPAKLSALNEISHRYVMAEIRRRLEQLRKESFQAALLDAPQLFEAGAERDCNVIVSVLADEAIRMSRIMQRDAIDKETAASRFRAQKSDTFFRTHSDYIIENNDAPDRLLPEVRRILAEMGVDLP
ncbi:MAG: dephospho-CoA kinase [Clostridia bacterium]|nr:dephospho-CoA kinase [Clostridia bacterium]